MLNSCLVVKQKHLRFYVDPETSKQSLDKSVKALGKQMDNLLQQIYLSWVSKVVKQI